MIVMQPALLFTRERTSSRWHGRCSFPQWLLTTNDPARRARFLQGGDFDHAVDNFGDSFGLVADWPALKCGRQPYPLAARGSRGCFDYQPRDRQTSGLTIRARGRKAESPFPILSFPRILANLPSCNKGVFRQR